MPLTEYRRKRRFNQTPEPEGGEASGGALRFVVQKHHASRLHYDFRLELDGVLLSWAVPKGPSLNPADKRLAMMVEDHPMDYRRFEGTIPKGNYGAGTVMVWDEGTYEDFEQSGDPATRRKNLKAGLKKGDLKFVLHGQKVSGAYVLAKIKGGAEDNAWLLIKKHDDFASEVDITKQDRSVLTGRSLDEIASGTKQWLKKPRLNLGKTPKKAQPARVKPMLATLTKQPIDSPDWLYEIKWDGYRIVAHLKDGQVRLKTRNDQDYTHVYQPVSVELSNLRIDCVLDGEMVVTDEHGRSDFGALQNYQKTGEGNLRYYAFDVPYADGHDLRSLPLTRRKEILQKLIEPLSLTQYSDHVVGRGSQFFAAAEAQQLEGIMAKRCDSSYLEGRRGGDWLKIKTSRRQEAVIGGFTDPRGSRHKLGALILGVYEGDNLVYIGHTGGGLNDKQLADLYARLHPLERNSSPFNSTFKTNAPVHWVEPRLLAEVSFAEWTADGHLRQPTFVGLREDKNPRTVVREKAVETPQEEHNDPMRTKAELTHLDKLYWPKEGRTKGDVVGYYDRISKIILPYLKNRPMSLNRHPNGIEGENFFQKNVEKHPDWVKTVPIFSESNQADIHWVTCNDRDTLLYLANLGCIELNPWHSRVQTLDNPDWCLIDLDAKTCPFESVVKTAQETHKLLEELGIPGYPKTSGKTGLHICIPLGAKYTYEQSKQFAQLLVTIVNERLPRLTSIERKPEKRKGKIYLDYLQNRTGQTMAAPYSLRPVPGATVSTPLKWSEVRKGLDPHKFTIDTIEKRLDKVGDLWEPVVGKGVDLKKVLDQLS